MNRKILVNGAFDILHIGHINLLNYAKNLGDYLLVAVDTDERIRTHKGTDRPVNPSKVRVTILKNLKAVDEVRLFNSDFELIDIIKTYYPDIRVIGSDWKNKKIIGKAYCKEIIFFDRTSDESTTKTLKNYVARREL